MRRAESRERARGEDDRGAFFGQGDGEIFSGRLTEGLWILLVEETEVGVEGSVIGLVLVAVGMGGGTGSSEAPMIARRGRLGADQPMILHMLDIPLAAES
ncbi:hypothetical protein CK203_092411 [Vitis vinifera]|uniref:Uncharacterized protein n=1 Tax=Vitis vinifera TaxID=29760 RepID=A0A438F0Q5_VITVI|nr:hypothetical protein CK203_092411 [Vitis vinifera]